MAEGQDDRYAGQQYQPCYIYTPESNHASKRRKLKGPELASGNRRLFGRLLSGTEPVAHVERRYGRFQEAWSCKESYLQDLLSSINSDTMSNVVSFIGDSDTSSGTIPTGFITTGPSIASHGLLFEQLQTQTQNDLRCAYIHLTSASAGNLKSVLKHLVRKATSQIHAHDEDSMLQAPSARKLLDYDLTLLYQHLQRHHFEKVVVSFQDAEGFDGGLLTELICLLRSWLDRIPFVLLFGIGTSISNFQDKLSKHTLRNLRGEQFDVEQQDAAFQRIAAAALGRSSVVRLGPQLSTSTTTQQRDHGQNVHRFISGLKYAYMSHFYANPLSILLADDAESLTFDQALYEAIRNLGSFRRLVEMTLDADDTQRALALVKDDEFLRSKVLQTIAKFPKIMDRLLDAVQVFHSLFSKVSVARNFTFMDSYVRAMAGELSSSVYVREVLLAITKMEPKAFLRLLEDIRSSPLEGSPQGPKLSDLHEKMMSLSEIIEGQQWVVTSEAKISQKRLRTAVVRQKIELSQAQPEMSEHQSTYVQLVHSVRDALKAYFEINLVDPTSLFLHEVFLYDMKSPYRETFSPKPRFAIERALSRPRDYLDCECCKPSAEGLAATQPVTAILYQLYLESGALINVFDLWSAFYAVIGGEDGEDCDARNALGLFYRSLAELKYIGMIKNSRKRPDHITKLSWKGL